MVSSPKSASEFRAPLPGPEHQVLADNVGTWEASIEIHPSPGAPAITSKGAVRSRLACGGMWLISDFLNETTGFEGHGICGYDPAKGKYVGTWVDPMRTFIALSEGSWDPVSRAMTMWYEASGPQGSKLRWREVTETLGPDTQVWRQYMMGADGQEFESMTVTYRRITNGE